MAAIISPAAAQGVTFSVLYNFTGKDGANPRASLISDAKGNLYGTTRFGGNLAAGVVFQLAPDGTYKVLDSLSIVEGALPAAELTADASGNYYTTTQTGGTKGLGVVLKLASDGTHQVLYNFTPKSGFFPMGGVVLDSAGDLYGVTLNGGAKGLGVLYKLASDGTYAILHEFTGSDGALPVGTLIADADGNLYGVTASGGSLGLGVVFKLGVDGSYAVLHSFNIYDGAVPQAGLVADKKGNLYGTTVRGGKSNAGVVFKLTPDGAFTVLHDFTGGSGGEAPKGTLIIDAKGDLFGTTAKGGASNAGVVFTVAKSGPYTVLYSFNGTSDGTTPFAGLVADGDGNLYGTTYKGGTSDKGVIYKVVGSGYLPAIPFDAFSAKLGILPKSFALASGIILSSKYSDGISPITEPVVLEIGPYAVKIPPGTFRYVGFGFQAYVGPVDGVYLSIVIKRAGTLRYGLLAAGVGGKLTGVTNPVPVSITIGDDTGSTTVTAKIKTLPTPPTPPM